MNTVSPDISPANSWRMSVGHVIKIRSLLSVRGVLIFLSHCNDISFNSSDLPSSLCLFLPSSIIPLWHTHGLLSLVLEAKEKLSNMKLCWVFLWLWLSAFWSVFFHCNALQMSCHTKTRSYFWEVSSAVHAFLVLITVKGLEAQRWLK